MLKISDDTIEIIADSIAQYIKQGRLLKNTAEGDGGRQGKENEVLWNNYIKRVDPHEKKYIVIIKSLLTKQAKEVFDKIKRYPNNYKRWMFDKKKWLRVFTEVEAKFIVKLYKQEGQKAIDLALKLSKKSYYKAEEIPISIAFDVYNPEVTETLVAQTTRFPAGVVGTSEEIIRREIANGLELGESIDKLRKRVTGRLGPTYIKNRAEMIARSETIYAANAGAELGYMQSGVVEGKKWLTALDERTCFPCTDMNNMTAPLGQPTWEKEGLDVAGVQSKYDLDFDYTEGAMPHPPLHPRCRCDITPIVKVVTKPSKQEIKKSFETYQDGGYQSINGHLRGEKISSKILPKVKKDIKNIDYMMKPSDSDILLYRGDGAGISADLFEKIPGLPHNVRAEEVLFGRIDGVRYDEYFSKKLKGKIFTDKAFVSTSLDSRLAMERFVPGNTTLSKYGNSGLAKISTPKGTMVADVEKISAMGARESEMLIHRGTKYKVDAIRFRPLPTEGREVRFYIEWDLSIVKPIKSYTMKSYNPEKATEKVRLGRYLWRKGNIIILN